MAAKIGRSGQPVQNDGGRPCTLPATACCACASRSSGSGSGGWRVVGQQVRPIGRDELAQARLHHAAGIFAGHRQHALAVDPGLDVGAPQDGVDGLLDEFRLALLDDQDRLLAGAEADELVVDQRIGDVEHVERNAAVAEHIGEPEHLERAHRGVVHAALHHDADVAGVAVEEFVELVLLDEVHGGGPALLDLLLSRAGSSRAAARCGWRRAWDDRARPAA